MLIIKIICIFLVVLFTLVNSAKVWHKEAVPAINFLLQAIGITGFIVLQWLV